MDIYKSLNISIEKVMRDKTMGIKMWDKTISEH